MKRIYHTWDKWECHKAGMHNNRPENKMSDDECRQAYADFLRNKPFFEASLYSVILYWKYSCEHNLSNESMNRIAWLGQASMCYATGIPSIFCAGFNLLNEKEREEANLLALKYLNIWLSKRNEPELTLKTAKSKTEANFY